MALKNSSKKIVIDGRLYGLENAGLGRYAMGLIDNLAKLDTKNEYFILLRKKYFQELNFPSNFHKVLAEIRHYSFSEQIFLPSLIKKINPDLVHFLHFNVPLIFKGKFVVTIHDMLMHRQKGRKTTTLSLPAYLIKRFGYKKVFEHAVLASSKIIVPSNWVKKELLEYFKVPEEKIIVTYEGV